MLQFYCWNHGEGHCKILCYDRYMFREEDLNPGNSPINHKQNHVQLWTEIFILINNITREDLFTWILIKIHFCCWCYPYVAQVWTDLDRGIICFVEIVLHIMLMTIERQYVECNSLNFFSWHFDCAPFMWGNNKLPVF